MPLGGEKIIFRKKIKELLEAWQNWYAYGVDF